MGRRGRFYPYLYHCGYIGLLGIGLGFMQVFHLGRAPRTKETLPDFLKWRRVTRHPLVFRGLTGSQRTPGFRGVTGFIEGSADGVPMFVTDVDSQDILQRNVHS